MEAFPDLSKSFKDYPKEVILKDGTGVTLRPLREGDEDLLFEMYAGFPEEDRWFLSHDVADLKLIKTWVKGTDRNGVLSIVAVLGGNIIAHAALVLRYYGAKCHIGKIRTSVDPSFRERYLGTWMLLDLINLAMGLGLKILEMRLVEGKDDSIIKSLKKLGFSKEATLRDYSQGRDGNQYDLAIMVKRSQRALDHNGGRWSLES
ncbi:MAG: GNAT family protein [Pseudomonadota bacterium]